MWCEEYLFPKMKLRNNKKSKQRVRNIFSPKMKIKNCDGLGAIDVVEEYDHNPSQACFSAESICRSG